MADREQVRPLALQHGRSRAMPRRRQAAAAAKLIARAAAAALDIGCWQLAGPASLHHLPILAHTHLPRSLAAPLVAARSRCTASHLDPSLHLSLPARRLAAAWALPC